MPFRILAPAPPASVLSSSYNEVEDVESESDVDMEESFRPVGKRPHLSTKEIVTPGEIVTDDPQWMRYD